MELAVESLAVLRVERIDWGGLHNGAHCGDPRCIESGENRRGVDPTVELITTHRREGHVDEVKAALQAPRDMSPPTTRGPHRGQQVHVLPDRIGTGECYTNWYTSYHNTQEKTRITQEKKRVGQTDKHEDKSNRTSTSAPPPQQQQQHKH